MASSASPIEGGSFLIYNCHSGKSLDVNPDLDSLRVQQWEVHGGENQNWLLERRDGGLYTISSVWGNRCLDVSGASKEPGARLTLWPNNSGTNQQWRLHQQQDKTYVIEAAHSKMNLDVDGESKENGAEVFQWPRHGRNNQRWWLIPTDELWSTRSNSTSQDSVKKPAVSFSVNIGPLSMEINDFQRYVSEWIARLKR